MTEFTYRCRMAEFLIVFQRPAQRRAPEIANFALFDRDGVKGILTTMLGPLLGRVRILNDPPKFFDLARMFANPNP